MKSMTETEKRYYETVSGKFAAYELILAHLLRKTMAQMSDTGLKGLQEDLLRQLNFYTTDTSLPEAARLEMRTVVTQVIEKAQAELG